MDRVASQLNTLSEVLETLTVRLLELEERLETHHQEVQSWRELAASPHPADGTDLRLDDTEERLSRVEALLQGLDEPGRRGLSPVHPCHAGPDMQPEQGPIDDPFPEDGEQPFMDDLADQLTA
ncbi:hypothetical protein CPCC7001_944 [Cyanobium sp. PCC 7001]|nr:hypothetical protein CPCC7001_944 [Cyanobium sp. PCC 7001]